MAKDYYLKFGSGDPSAFTGLSPTFTIFSWEGVTAQPAPGITETPAGSGIYGFQYGPTVSILFKADAGSSVPSIDRFIVGSLDPIQSVDEKVGTLQDSFGTTSIDPQTVIGYLKRTLEFLEGAATFTKSSGRWLYYSRGASTLLFDKTLTNSPSQATKS